MSSSSHRVAVSVKLALVAIAERLHTDPGVLKLYGIDDILQRFGESCAREATSAWDDATPTERYPVGR